jgi:hypothetical protein
LGFNSGLRTPHSKGQDTFIPVGVSRPVVAFIPGLGIFRLDVSSRPSALLKSRSIHGGFVVPAANESEVSPDARLVSWVELNYLRAIDVLPESYEGARINSEAATLVMT